MIDEAERSIHDALCVVRSLVKEKYVRSHDALVLVCACVCVLVVVCSCLVSLAHSCPSNLHPTRFLIAGGGAPETELSINLAKLADNTHGVEGYCIKRFAEAMEVIPYTLAENAGLNPIDIVTELRKRHVDGEKTAGINVRKVTTKREDQLYL